MAARKKAKKAVDKKKASKKPVEPVQETASHGAELEELRAMKEELTKGFEELRRERENFKREEDLARINREMAAGNPPPVQKTVDPIEEQRQRAREERRRKRAEQAKAAPAPVTSIDKARAKKQAAEASQKEPITLPMDELHKWKLTALNRDYADAVKKIKEPLVAKYNRLLEMEARELAQKDPECVKAHREQVMCINELVKLLGDQLPEGYAITKLLTDKGVIVAQYIPDRAGKPLSLPEMVDPDGG